VEFLNFLIVLVSAWLVWRRPERERLAFGLLVVSCLLMMALFLIGTRTSFVPGLNI
jgi:heme A synthase